MLHCDNIESLWWDAVVDVMRFGKNLDSRNGPCKELVGWSAKLVNTDFAFLTDPIRKLSASYAAAELIWYLSQETDIAGIVAYAPQYEKFAEDGKAFGAYGWRWRSNPGFISLAGDDSSQLGVVCNLLSVSPSTRQAVVAHWDSGDLMHAVVGEKKDLPCTLSLQFLARDGQLHMITTMRSNDVWLGLPYDIFCFTGIQRIMADALGLGYGTYTHNVGSIHIYQQHFDRCKEVMARGPHPRLYATDGFYVPTFKEMAIKTVCSPNNFATIAEKVGRLNPELVSSSCSRSDTFLQDLVYCAWHKTVPRINSRELVRSAALKEGLR